MPFIFPYLIRLHPATVPLSADLANWHSLSGSPLSQHSGDEHFRSKLAIECALLLVEGQSIYDKLHQPKFHWLIFSNPLSDVRC